MTRDWRAMKSLFCIALFALVCSRAFVWQYGDPGKRQNANKLNIKTLGH
jgi:hypothetical protein